MVKRSKTAEAGMDTVTIRLPIQMLKGLDAYVDSKLKKGMGAPYTRSDGVRDAVREMLERQKGAS